MTTRRRTEKKKRVVEKRVIVGVEDMVLLRDTRDVGIVENLRDRLTAGCIYTYIGHVLVVCNPYKWLPIYEKEVMKQYVHQARVDVSPHIFAVAEAAYRNMVTEEESQCVIISGESGAGKTEASKQIQAYIAEVSGGGESVDHIKRVFLESNPVLEAFGNAKTLRNNNSSRFGKYFELKFNYYGCPQGGVVTNYLLEKSRICNPGEGERNFHIFYQILASSFCANLHLTSPDNYRILSCSNCYCVDGLNDSEEFNVTINAMRSVGMGKNQIQAILSLVAAIMHLGNVVFTPRQVSGADGSAIQNKDELRHFCDLTKLDLTAVEHSLTFRQLQTMAAGGRVESYEVPQNTSQASARRDALCKSLYERMFNLIVSRINVALDPSKAEVSPRGLLSVGVLDIYGFEIFQNNGFEQLCINYVNEKLQQIFIELTLRAEQDEYRSEGITWTPIPFFNNKVVCDLLDSARPAGIFRILDDTCKTMHGTKANMDIDRKFTETASQIHGSHKHFVSSSSSFTIKHYAGDVTYSCGKFGVSNKDALGQDLVILLKSSQDKLIQFIYPEEIDLNDKKGPPTAGQRIRVQCNELVNALMQCSPHYVRCIKSNDQKRALNIDVKRVQHQSKYLGLCENIKVRRAGFAYRAEYHRFLERFNILSPRTYPEWRGSDKAGCKEILKEVAAKIPGLTREEMQLGNTKLFIRQPETYFELEKLREIRIGDFVVVIQRAWRSYHNRKEYVTMQMEIAKIYKDAGKSRRRDSIFRPYKGDYLESLPLYERESLTDIKDAIFRIIDHYDENENIVFADGNCYQLCSKNTAPLKAAISRHDAPPPFTYSEDLAGVLQSRLVVLTNGALYIMERTVEEIGHTPHGTHQPSPKSLPKVILRRRIPLPKKYMQGAILTPLADSTIAISCTPHAALPTVRRDHWKDDSEVTHCPVTGKKFGLFVRRHHCRISGGIYCEEVSNFRQNLPDFGFYNGPERVADAFIGLESIDIMEDVVLFCDRKSELLGHLMNEWKKINKSKFPITFTDEASLRSAPVSAMSNIPVSSMLFKPSPSVPDEEFKLSTAGPSRISVTVPVGLSHAIVEQRQKKMANMRREAEAKRKRQDAERRERQAQREAQREEERRIRQEQKRAQKAEAKAALQRAAEMNEATNKKKSAALKGARKFGDQGSVGTTRAPEPASGATSELAAAMARRRAAQGNI
mmetsp:Transcript_10766/g.16368  ORF Transcript_10766/g.16368 Transcript_10766/m.16368 type:complete len:1196 (-) Transcript_10766:132-3719(-)|eukprot:CAMPEP_0185029796 /NCGR_PEP_ID=MMETSP1103-20130426/16340_1 /TAXON_ID=36769 /ORGANISM="Paraphysomonas bandaiensis, Strain Caron Lab Isolate" /LENGTH=1195 /DNA_ID=CAMNT_0027564681 /DNA_START=46 /DNA_END=3633 /DNA_ORIENTATION=+